jgi:hydrogenase nickel incorporation protein HypA/HybF
MHEFAVTKSILAIILEKAREVKAAKITKVDLLVGRLTGYIPEQVQLQFDILSRNTEAVGANLIFHQPPAKIYCRKCGLNYTSDSFNLVCPECQTMEIDIVSGTELYVENMEVEL